MRISDWSSDVCSSDLYRSVQPECEGNPNCEHAACRRCTPRVRNDKETRSTGAYQTPLLLAFLDRACIWRCRADPLPSGTTRQHTPADRKSTRLNSSH